MTRGNQRDEARLKNAKDAAGKGVKKEGSYLLRKEADSTALADKVRRALHSEMRSFIIHDKQKSLHI
jgi:predicted transposase YbfD/YdcC